MKLFFIVRILWDIYIILILVYFGWIGKGIGKELVNGKDINFRIWWVLVNLYGLRFGKCFWELVSVFDGQDFAKIFDFENLYDLCMESCRGFEDGFRWIPRFGKLLWDLRLQPMHFKRIKTRSFVIQSLGGETSHIPS